MGSGHRTVGKTPYITSAISNSNPRLLDYFLVDAPPTSLSLSATSDFLATTHVDDLGIYLWSNRSLYTSVPLCPLPCGFNPATIDLPSARGDREEGESGAEEEEDICEGVSVCGCLCI